jgi:hypothetical protein
MLESELAQSRKEDRGSDLVTTVDICSTDQNACSTLTQNALKDVECAGCERMAGTHQRSLEKIRGELKIAR